MVLVDEAGPGDLFLKIGITAPVHDGNAPLGRIAAILVGVHHIEPLIYMMNTERTIIVDMQLTGPASKRGYLNDACCTSGAVLGGLGGILLDDERLDIRRIDIVQQGEIAHDTVNNDKRVITAGERRGTAQPYCIHGICAVAFHSQTCHATANGIEGIGSLVPVVHAVFTDDVDVKTVARGCKGV